MQSRILCNGTVAAVAARRMRNILGTVMGKGGWRCSAHEVKLLNTSSGGTVKIGEISFQLKAPRNPELVPVNHMTESISPTVVQHLRWIMQKDLLGQDVFLIGPPGPLRRSIAMQYLELTKREVEYVALSRDTTETDLKQRREIRAGTAFYIDQCAVRAATQGRILILEGLEKAERNVLPVLNNLLENREMQLEDGRFLMSAQRYDKLLQEHPKEELDAWKIVRVSEDFRVIALGLPVPRYTGNPLDPPLRSRFQARDIYYLPFKDQLEILYSIGPNVTTDKVSQLLSFATTLCSQESSSLGLPDFPVDNLPSAIKVLDLFPMMSCQQLIQRLYPYEVMLGKEGRSAVEGVLSRFELLDSRQQPSPTRVVSVEPLNREQTGCAAVTLRVSDTDVTLQVPAGSNQPRTPDHSRSFISTPTHARLLAEMMQSHMVKDMCLMGAKGCGKSVIAKEFAEMLGYSTEPVMLYQDMTGRDLLQQRYTLPNGDTAWRVSPLVSAAREGKLVLLDGIHRVNLGTLAVLSRLIHDRELALYDGTRLLRSDRYQILKEEMKMSDSEMEQRSIFPIHPSFRLLALAEPPVQGSRGQQWLNPEILTMFFFHTVKPLDVAEETSIIQGMTPNAPAEAVQLLLHLTHSLRKTNDPTAQSLASSLSTRQLLRICRRLSQHPEETVGHAVNKACLSRFLPSLARSALQKNLANCSIEDGPDPGSTQNLDLSCEIKDGILRIGKASLPVYNPHEKMKVPDVLFYENEQHMTVMEDMLKDFLMGEHLLLVGNQGVGKNKIVDRFLHLMNRPREYLQLHRDTTVQTLTLQPSVRDGIIIYEDSPLVRAVKMGHILVIDEADKAPTNVTCILKTLVENGEMILADGRRIISNPRDAEGRPNIIVMHPDFRMIVLANRPGFPFLGNDFFGALGDIFSCHAVDNPKPHAELAMLKQYGPDVPDAVLQKLVATFGELRAMADQGTITYPYSTREVVNIVKHLQKFPDEGLANVVRNVFDFDSYNKETREILITALHKHGIPVGAKPTSVNLAKE
nr:von Willebrand factor A domain-containing protein 8 isoform X2 [Paramormyrops kingsleyae]